MRKNNNKNKSHYYFIFFVKLLAWNLLHRHTAVSGLMENYCLSRLDVFSTESQPKL